jgi:precorrin-4 methylase
MLVACKQENKANPVPFDKMRHLMLDIMKADEQYIKITLKDTLQKMQRENFRLYDQLFRSYGVSKEQFYTSYKYYEAHPIEFKELIDSIDATIVNERKKR